MNTHILIPIKDIEDRINLRKNSPIFKQIEKELKQRNGISPQQKIARDRLILEIGVFSEILSWAKQISLDKKDIEEKAKLKYPDSEYIPNPEIRLQDLIKQNKDNLIKRRRDIYSQALKDLL